jgi:UDP-N-acetylglucosamine kinase
VLAEGGDPISPEQIEEIYATLIRSTLFGKDPNRDPSPTLILLGGQPGSGRSRASARLLREYDAMVAVRGDDLRIFHPQYRFLVTNQRERSGTALTNATSSWVQASIQDARNERRSLLLEGTFGDPDVTLATAAQFRAVGFHVRVVAIATPRVLSLVTATSRYLRDRKLSLPARFTSLADHDQGYDGTTRLIATLPAADVIDQMTIISRNGSTLFDQLREHDNSNEPFADASSALRDGRNPTSWGARSSMELLGELKQISNFAVESGSLTPDLADLLIEAHAQTLDHVVPRLSVDPDSPQAKFIHQAVTEQLVFLRRSAATARAAPAVVSAEADRGPTPTPPFERD